MIWGSEKVMVICNMYYFYDGYIYELPCITTNTKNKLLKEANKTKEKDLNNSILRNRWF